MFFIMGFFTLSLSAQSATLSRQSASTLEYNMEVDGLQREFIVKLPSVYNPASDKTYPVVFMLHGGGGSGKKYYNISGWKELGEREGIITVFPTGYKVCIKDGETGQAKTGNYWLTSNKSSQLCQGGQAHEDVNFIRAIAGFLGQNYKVDASRFYLTGFSNGMGFTLDQVIPKLSDIFAAVGGTGSLIYQPVRASNPIPCLMMIGENDANMVRRRGNQALPITAQAIQQDEWLQELLALHTNLLQVANDPIIEEKRKHTNVLYNQATNGGNQILQFAVLKGLGHVYPRGIPEHNNIRAAEIFWNFFQEYQK